MKYRTLDHNRSSEGNATVVEVLVKHGVGAACGLAGGSFLAVFSAQRSSRHPAGVGTGRADIVSPHVGDVAANVLIIAQKVGRQAVILILAPEGHPSPGGRRQRGGSRAAVLPRTGRGS